MVTLVPVDPNDAGAAPMTPQLKLVPVAPEDLAGAQPETATAPTNDSMVPDWLSSALSLGNREASIVAAEGRKGLSGMVGMPVDAANFVLEKTGVNDALLSGENYVRDKLGLDPASKGVPFGGSQSVDSALALPIEGANYVTDTVANAAGTSNPLHTDPAGPQPQNALERILGRTAYEAGATAAPVGGVLTAGKMLARNVVDNLAQKGPGVISSLFGKATQAAQTAPGQIAAREGAYATAAGAGAGTANELVGNPQHGDNAWSDTLGSLMGAFTLAGGSKVVKKAADFAGPVLGGQNYADDLAGEHVATEILSHASDYQNRPIPASGREDAFDSSSIADSFRRPARVEETIPGYQANIADRTQDPGLATLNYNTDARTPGQSNVRREANERAVNTEVAELAPDGNPALFKDALETARTRLIQVDDAAATEARSEFERLRQELAPVMGESSARGNAARLALSDAYDRAKQAVDAAYARVRDRRVALPVDDLASRFNTITESLPLNDRNRFVPQEAGVPDQLADNVRAERAAANATGANVPPARAEAEAAWDALTGVGPARQPRDRPATVPFEEVKAVRSGLTDNVRAARAKPGGAQEARISDLYRATTDQFLDERLPPHIRELNDNANAANRDLNDRFGRQGDALEAILRTREGGDYSMDDSLVTNRLLPTDRGNIGDFQAAMREAGNDSRLQESLQDALLADIERRDLLNRPDHLDRYLADRNVVLDSFPDLRERLQAAGAAARNTHVAEETAASTRNRLSTPSGSAEAKYLQHGDTGTANAMSEVLAGKDPRAAIRQLVTTAGGDEAARTNARAAFWTVIAKKKFLTPGITGGERWNAGKIDTLFKDPNIAAVADELWADDPENLQRIKDLFSALHGAEGSTRAKAVGTSGTPQATGAKEAAPTGAMISSRLRAAHEGRSSWRYALSDLIGGYMRRARKATMDSSISRIMAEAVNNPDLAADLLEAYNPATLARSKQMLTQKYGVRATETINLLDEAAEAEDGGDDPSAAAARRKPLELTIHPDDHKRYDKGKAAQ